MTEEEQAILIFKTGGGFPLFKTARGTKTHATYLKYRRAVWCGIPIYWGTSVIRGIPTCGNCLAGIRANQRKGKRIV